MNRAGIEDVLKQAIAPERSAFRLAGALAAVATISAVLLLGVSGWFITGAALAGHGGVLAVQTFNYLLPSAGIRLLAIIRTTSRYGERLCGHRAALMTLASVRARLFDRIMTAHDVRAVSAGDAVSRLVQDIGALEDSLIRKPALPAAIAGGLVGLGLTWLASPWASAVLLLLFAGLALWAHLAAPRLLARPADEMADALARLKGSMVDHASASPEILAYDLAPAIGRVLAQETSALDGARRRFARGEAIIDGGLTLCGGLAMGAVLAISDAALPITVLAVLAAAGAIESLAAYVRGVSRNALVAAAFSRLEVLAADQSISAGAGAAPPSMASAIAIDSNGVSVQLEAGSRLGISGRSGSGKTTLLETLAGIRPALEDCGLSLDGKPLTAFPSDSLRRTFALSPQDAQLLSGTVRDNLRVARAGLADEDLWPALDVACFADEVRAMPHGLDQWVGDGGARLSGGQRKRLSLARALLAGSPWLLLDEPSEGLDMATEARVRERLDRWLEKMGTGLIVVSHRPAFLALAEKGRIVELGR
ncbi:MAG TPA: ATP-binding cassette domain-containing protein [Croceibacterium sp.]|nr:ATP-binding cassette domain-containing protein [Croceibacterium sp.]